MNKSKQLVLAAARLSGFGHLCRAMTRRRLRILCYHGLWVTPGPKFGDRLFMNPEMFRDRMLRLKRSKVPVLSLADAVERLEQDRLPAGATVITADDGWASTHSHMLPILEELDLPATIYITSWYSERGLPVINVAVTYIHQCAGLPPSERLPAIARIEALPIPERADALCDYSRSLGVPLDWWNSRQFHLMTPNEIRDAARRGLDMQLHTHRHTSQLETLHEELVVNRQRLASWTGLPADQFRHFCYPSGQYIDGIEPILAGCDIRSATLVDQGMNAAPIDRYRLRRFLDGRSISNAEFDAYLAGLLDVVDAVVGRIRHAG